MMPDTCDIRERLDVDYIRAMNLYHGKIFTPLNALADQATDDAAHLYRAAVQARVVLQKHLTEHGCGIPICRPGTRK
jgi:hypothetical protein